eukprot:1149232-Pelagomonas_calceolata.AAC.5
MSACKLVYSFCCLLSSCFFPYTCPGHSNVPKGPLHKMLKNAKTKRKQGKQRCHLWMSGCNSVIYFSSCWSKGEAHSNYIGRCLLHLDARGLLAGVDFSFSFSTVSFSALSEHLHPFIWAGLRPATLLCETRISLLKERQQKALNTFSKCVVALTLMVPSC